MTPKNLKKKTHFKTNIIICYLMLKDMLQIFTALKMMKDIFHI